MQSKVTDGGPSTWPLAPVWNTQREFQIPDISLGSLGVADLWTVNQQMEAFLFSHKLLEVPLYSLPGDVYLVGLCLREWVLCLGSAGQ